MPHTALDERIWALAAQIAAYWSSVPQGFLLDVIKTLIGTVAGAVLGFKYGIRKDELTRLNTQKTAGNLAIATLSQMINDFADAKKALLEERARVAADQPRSPKWMLYRPLHFRYSPGMKFDLGSLMFIFEELDGVSVFEKLVTVDMLYHDFFSALATHGATVEIAQNKLSDSGLDQHEARPAAELTKILGFAVPAKIESFVDVIDRHLDETEAGTEFKMRAAAKALPALVKRRFVDDTIALRWPDR